MTDCLFCKIAAGEIPANIVASDDRFVGFRDIAAQAPTHVLVIPRAHVASLNEVSDPGLIGGLLLFARRIADQEGLAGCGYRVVINTNADAGQTVFHLHAHVLGGRVMRWPPG
jgi:histidine triad (HIT) family protein